MSSEPPDGLFDDPDLHGGRFTLFQDVGPHRLAGHGFDEPDHGVQPHVSEVRRGGGRRSWMRVEDSDELFPVLLGLLVEAHELGRVDVEGHGRVLCVSSREDAIHRTIIVPPPASEQGAGLDGPRFSSCVFQFLDLSPSQAEPQERRRPRDPSLLRLALLQLAGGGWFARSRTQQGQRSPRLGVSA